MLTGPSATHLIFCHLSKYDIDQALIQSQDMESRLALETLEAEREKGEVG